VSPERDGPDLPVDLAALPQENSPKTDWPQGGGPGTNVAICVLGSYSKGFRHGLPQPKALKGSGGFHHDAALRPQTKGNVKDRCQKLR
jgi:hypothetical protein